MNAKFVLFLLLWAIISSACRKSPAIALDATSAAPGDVVALRVAGGAFAKKPIVKVGREPAVIVTASDTMVTFIVPSLSPQTTELSVEISGKPMRVDFQVQASDTERLWFTLKGSTILFKERQSSREDFVPNKGHSMNRLLMEFFDSRGELVALTYIDHPGMIEVPAQDGKGLSMVQRQGEVPFDVNIPVLPDVAKMRVSSLITTTKDITPTIIAEVKIPAR